MDKNTLKFEFENDSTKQYIVTYLENGQDVVDYEMEIINKDSTPGVLNVEIKQLKDKIKVMYDVTNKTSIKEYLKGITLTKVQFITIVTNIENCLIGCKNYFLDEKKFLVSLDCLFINKKDMKVYLVYCPFKMEVVENTDLVYKNIVKSLIIDFLSFDEKDSENVIQKTLTYLRKDEFSMVEFKNYLKEFQEENINVVCDTARIINKKENLIDNKSGNLINGSSSSSSSSSSSNDNKIINNKETVKKINKIQNDETKVSGSNVLILLLQLIVLGIIGLIAMIGSFGMIMITAIVFIIVIDLILVIFVLTRNSRFQKSKMRRNKLDTSFINNKQEKTNSQNKTSKREIITEMSFDTELLDDKTAYLLSKKAGTVERIAINKNIFKIGRMPGEVDYISDNIAVGKIHGEIRKNEDKYYVVDLNSRNGTYLNGNKLNSNDLYEIKNDDTIVFANSEFTFLYN